MILNILILLIGLAVLLYSADKVVLYSDKIAKYHNLSPLFIGLTIVAFGTSAPELVITIFAALNNPPNTDAIIGNVMGSNIANILLIFGCGGLFFKLDFKSLNKKDTIYLSIISAYFIFILIFNKEIDYLITAGFILIIFYARYIFINFKKLETEVYTDINFSNLIYPLLLLAFIGLFAGGKLFLDKSLEIFISLGIPEVTIGVTILAIGTSLPELATVFISYIKKNIDIGIGNIIGSNIMNILFVFLPGILITRIRGVEFPINEIPINMIVVFALATLFIIIIILSNIKLNRLIAILFLLFYISCGVWVFI